MSDKYSEEKLAMPDTKIDQLGYELWQYLRLNMDLYDKDGNLRGDYIIALGSSEDETAIRAAELFVGGHFKGIVCSGGNYPRTFEDPDGTPVKEAEYFARVIEDLGVPPYYILVEDEAKNTKQNIIFSEKLLLDLTQSYTQSVLVCAPIHERRVLLTAQMNDPGVDWRVTSPITTYQRYIQHKFHDGRISALMGQVIRIELYGRKGDLIKETIPDSVISAYQELFKEGFRPIALDGIKNELDKFDLSVDMSNINNQELNSEQRLSRVVS